MISRLREEMIRDKMTIFVKEMEEYGFSHDELLKIIEEFLAE